MRRNLKICAFFLCMLVLCDDLFGESVDKVSLAVETANKGNYIEAKKLYTEAIESDPKNGRAWRGLATIAKIQDDDNKAIYLYKKGWECGDSICLKAWAAILAGNDNFSAFGKLVPELLKYKDSDIEVRFLLVFYCLKRHEKDVQLLNQVLSGLKVSELDGQNDDNLYTFVRGFEELGKTKEAEDIQDILKKRAEAIAKKARGSK